MGQFDKHAEAIERAIKDGTATATGVNGKGLQPARLAGWHDEQLAAMSEKEFTAQVIKLAQLFQWRVAHFRTVRVQRANGKTYYETPVQADGAGFLDLELVRPPRIIKAELKVKKNVTTAEQKMWIGMYERIPGIECYVWKPKDWQEIVRVLK